MSTGISSRCIFWPVRLVQRPDTYWSSAVPGPPAADNLARCYEQLARYLELKSRSLILILKMKARHRCTIWLSPRSADGDIESDETLAADPLTCDRGQRGTRRTLHYYFVAQDITSVPALLIFSIKHCVNIFAQRRAVPFSAADVDAGPGVPALSRCILLRQPYQHDPHFERVLRILMLRWSGCAITARLPITQNTGFFAEQFTRH